MDKPDIKMIDIGDKAVTERIAKASGLVFMKPSTLEKIMHQQIEKGDVLAVAKIAGVIAAKRCPEIIPLCHPIGLASVEVYLMPNYQEANLSIIAKVKSSGQTGVEMEALTAVSAAALTIYDMCKSIDKDMTISDIKLLEKKGGRSGHYKRLESVEEEK